MRELTLVELIALGDMLNKRDLLLEKEPTHCQLEDIDWEICALADLNRDCLSDLDFRVALTNLRELCNMGVESIKKRGLV